MTTTTTMTTMTTTMTTTNIHGLSDGTLGRAITAKSLGLVWLQDAKAMSPGGTHCEYRSVDGRRCAVGHLLTAAADLQAIGTGGAIYLANPESALSAALRGVLFEGETAPDWLRELLCCLQRMHDAANPGEVRESLIGAGGLWLNRAPEGVVAWRAMLKPHDERRQRLLVTAAASLAHMVIQGRRAGARVHDGWPACVYLADNGDTCAVGCLMVDDDRDPALPGLMDLRDPALVGGDASSAGPASSRKLLDVLRRAGLDTTPTGIELLADLQDVHDTATLTPVLLARAALRAVRLRRARIATMTQEHAEVHAEVADVLQAAVELVMADHMDEARA